MHSPQSNSNRRTVVLPSPIHTALLNNPHHTPADNTTTSTPTRSTTNPIPIAIPPNPANGHPPQPHSSHSSGPSSAKAFLMAMGMTSPVGIQTQHQQHPNPTPSNWLPASQNSSLSFSSPASQLSRTRSWNVVYPPQNLSRHKSASSTTNAYSTGNPFAKSRTNSVSDFCHSASSLSSQPQSPAASFLSSFTERASTISPRSGEEGEEVGGYVLGEVLGTGMFSVVRKAFTMRDQLDKIKVVAVKIIKKEADTPEADSNCFTRTANVGRNAISDESSGSQSLSETFLDRELDIWRQLDHPNLLKMIEVIDHPQATFIFCDFCPGGNMLTYLRRKGKPGLPEPEAARLWTQLASAVLYLHEILCVVHRDIKLENILLSETGDLKLGDFGFADYSHQKDRLAIPATMGSLAYCAPELIRCDKTSTTDSPASIPTKLRAGDCWALGVILFAFITGSLPFADEFEPRMILKISNVQYAWSTTSVAPSSTPSSDTNPSAGSTDGIEAPSAPPTLLPHQQSTNSFSSPVLPSSFSASSSLSSCGPSGCTLYSSAPSTSVPVDRQSCLTDPKSMGSPLVRSLVAGLFNIKWWERWSVRMALESSWVRSFRV